MSSEMSREIQKSTEEDDQKSSKDIRHVSISSDESKGGFWVSSDEFNRVYRSSEEFSFWLEIN